MAQPVWITPAGSLGTIPEGVFYTVPLVATDPIDTVYYEVLAGTLPPGVYCDPNTGIIAGVPLQVAASTTSKFAIRAYTTQVIAGKRVIKALSDRTFELTVAVNSNPQFITPNGQIAEYFDGTQVSGLQVNYTDPGGTTDLVITLVSGSLPPGLKISSNGLISGYIEPNTTSNGAMAGFDVTGETYDEYPFDFSTQSVSANYSFTLRVASPVASNLGTFSIFVVSRNAMTADDTYFTADNTYITADATPVRIPILLNTPGSLGNVRNNSFYAYQFDGLDFDGDQVKYAITPIPTIPPGLTLDPVSGWLYGFIPDTGTTQIDYNFAVQVYKATNPTVISSYYYFSMTIIGEVSTDVTWLTPSFLGYIDNGATSTFYVNAISNAGIPLLYQLKSGSDSNLPQGLELLPSGNIAGRVSFDTFALDGGTTTFDAHAGGLGLPYFGTPTTFDMSHTFTVNAYSVNGLISVFQTFTITVIRTYDKPYNNLYIQCMPPQNDRALINSLIQNNDIFPPNLIYRNDDLNFGVAKNVVYWHAYGLTPTTIDNYVASLDLNHYWKNLVLGSIKTAQALDNDGNVIYEVVYSEVVDTLVNNQGISVGKEVLTPYKIEHGTTDIVYPNSLEDMRNQVIDVIGQISDVLPRWMLSKQANGQVLGFTPAWVIAYTKPGQSGQVAYNLQTIFGNHLNLVDFEADRYELDSLLTKNWNRTTQQWNPTPPSLTIFDVGVGAGSAVGWDNNTMTSVEWQNNNLQAATWVNSTSGVYPFGTTFDGNSLQFIDPVDMYSNTTEYDKYLLFPKRNILQ